ncbi:hypothetical protein RFI_01919 [Reticulomyxa filosa]|uniref:Kelch motif family protein n=1 Tax=Reticulomyxa filosa TaxID=46433 RepID=X6P9E0_RETFI|nr:hypothetical protein RFI_01919 [Reticulomyxa filosa]|eukprot:ETO35155.1 hypothetical protein RFI_01919 [Reticulomyxa filosa]
MGNRTTIQKPHERQTKQSQPLNTIFQTLKELPTPLTQSQCVPHKNELIICGGSYERACYSYHTLKNEYKFICEYPSDVKLSGHCVVKLIDNNKDSNQITLLSFGSGWDGKNHTLVMKYVSVWDNKSNNHNQWVPFTDNRNHPIIIGSDQDHDYVGARAVIGGRNNNLLFITYPINNISVFDLNTFQFIKHDTLLTNDYIEFHCFVSNSENRQVQEIMKTNEEKNKQSYQMLLFCVKTGLSIEYDEDRNTFKFHQLLVCKDIASFKHYAYVCINDVIFFFGGWNDSYANAVILKLVHKYSIRENKWMTFRDTLPNPLYNCVAILSEEDSRIHIIGGSANKKTIVSTHMKTKVFLWDISLLVMICLFLYFDEYK